jgi:hypothetical protein
MKIRSMVWGCIAALATLPAAAADVDGRWNASVDTPQGPFAMVFEFKADGEKLTGAMSNDFMGSTPISDGVIKGNEFSFKLTIMAGPAGDITIKYRGYVKGDDLNLLSTFEGTPPEGAPEGEQTLVAKRAK